MLLSVLYLVISQLPSAARVGATEGLVGYPMGFSGVRGVHLLLIPGEGYAGPLLALFFPIISCLASSLLIG